MNLIYQGKVRDVYEVDKEKLLIVASDRISAFDFVLPTPIPDKGKILTRLSFFWFNYVKDVIDNHLISGTWTPPGEDADKFRDRSMLVKRAKRIDLECIVRGYLSGSGWKEYQKEQSICGIKLPSGLKESARLPETIFTPSTKAPDGEHDINIDEGKAADIVGKDVFRFVKEKSIEIYEKASYYAETKGIILADTKFEFGMADGKIILIDEALTPDSSRFWEKSLYQPGRPQDSFDKQFVRDYLEKTIRWNKKPPVPELPREIVEKTREKYLSAQRRLCDGV
ncbi:MAG: phosphoribosylaminoimidazolesuccinocarboxamide synthase [bacterium]|nr:phosphoribosylaminoimidazolesuccinocarboxamide synthase [bacterium]